ncbi:MAG: hydroxyglutarate oxidase [Microbacterium sp. SCN 70-27]|uniref:L-2-hydroxyglutarate oxidase n=1 Tax=unclassified Microbacterium TaxID=2609290 RepID=UPI00086894B9|nr:MULTISPECIES: L-2-hydroxyglutarate oxidase [unclassified Microbacterium]MBN9224447.1 L-2-hydroxyglutarate oxidase [Microbacterium sp.]ODT28383.1 MAG: hydroxyglutarate oxidase [Microbacterium sp. SCN 70-27]
MSAGGTSTQSFVVVGAGILGAAVGRELTRRFPSSSVTLLEKEDRAAAHQTGHNSGVVHAGLYYEPGGLKARLCRRGVSLLKDFCDEKSLPYVECGKLVVALDDAEEARLQHIHERAQANGAPGVRLTDAAGIRDIEPQAVGQAALVSPTTAITDYAAVTRALVEDITAAGGRVEFGREVTGVERGSGRATVHTDAGPMSADHVFVCAGLQSDRVARRSGGDRHPSIVPFFGQYFLLESAYRDILQGLVYPVPDPRYPFLGVHLTKRHDGEMTVGPNAFLSLSREGYRGLGLSPRDLAATLTDGAFWRFSAANAGSAVREARSVLSQRFFLQEAQRYVPALEGARATRLVRGIRAQAMDASGRLLDDFAIDETSSATLVRNAPSPGATSSLAIAEHLVDALDERR